MADEPKQPDPASPQGQDSGIIDKLTKFVDKTEETVKKITHAGTTPPPPPEEKSGLIMPTQGEGGGESQGSQAQSGKPSPASEQAAPPGQPQGDATQTAGQTPPQSPGATPPQSDGQTSQAAAPASGGEQVRPVIDNPAATQLGGVTPESVGDIGQEAIAAAVQPKPTPAEQVQGSPPPALPAQ